MIGINRMRDREMDKSWYQREREREREIERERDRERERWKRRKLSMRRTGLSGSRNNNDLKNDRHEQNER